MTRIGDKSFLPLSMKRAYRESLKLYTRARVLTSRIQLLPDFIIIGAQRCGTTSLYRNLVQHPCVAPAIFKEVHFFDNNFMKGIAWYRAHFPSFLHKYYVEQIRKQELVTGESSPYYIFHPHASKRILETVPQVKLIALLRNPVDRAYSHFRHEVRLGVETLPFEDVMGREEERLRGEIEKMLEDENYYSFNHEHYSYLSRGIYVDQLKIWMKNFPKEQILILKSEDFFNNPSAVFGQIIEFLRLPNWEPKEYRKYNVGYYARAHMDATIRKRLIDYFEPHNQRLYEYLGVNFGWNR